MNRNVYILIISIFAVAYAGELRRAIVKMEGPGGSGVINFTQPIHGGPVHIQGIINGLDTGLHGLHVHEKGDLTGGCLTTGEHFNPTKSTHGAPDDKIRHVGDLGNIRSTKGVANIDIIDDVMSLGGEFSIIGRGLVVHSGEDDLGKTNNPLSKTTGNSGTRAACGIIGIVDKPLRSSSRKHPRDICSDMRD